MTQDIGPRGPIRITRPDRDGNGWSRAWGRTIAGVRYAFTAVVMPLTGDLRYTIQRFNGYVGGPEFACAWDLVHSITVKAQPLNWGRPMAGAYVSLPRVEFGNHVELGFTVKRDAAASPDNRWSLRVYGVPVSAHRLLKSAKSAAAKLAAVQTAALLIGKLETESQPSAFAGCTFGDAGRTMSLRRIEAHAGPVGAWVFPANGEVAELCQKHGEIYGTLAKEISPSYTAEPQFPAGTPEHEAYRAELTAELGKFARGDEPYPYPAADAEAARDQNGADDDEHECEGHESLDGAHMGETVYCDGTCKPSTSAPFDPDRQPRRRAAPVSPIVERHAAQTGQSLAAAEADLRDRAEALDPEMSGPERVTVERPTRHGGTQEFCRGQLVRINDGTAVWRVTRFTTRGGVTPGPYALLTDTYNGERGGAYVSALRQVSIQEGLKATAPETYRQILPPYLQPHGFVLDGGRDGDELMAHESGVEVGVHRGGVRINYLAPHGGAPDENPGVAWFDLKYGTSYEVVADVAVGLVHAVMGRTHAEHHRGVAEALRDVADVGDARGNDATVTVYRHWLRERADELAAPDTECRAAAFARRATAVLQGLIMQVADLGARDCPVDPAYLRAVALQTSELMLAAPEVPTADQVVEHLRAAGTDAVIVADETTTPAGVDALIDTMVAAGWTLAPDAEYVGGKRVRYLVPPEAVAADLFVRRESDLPAGAPKVSAPVGVPFRNCVLHGADCKPSQNGRPCLGMQESGAEARAQTPGYPTNGCPRKGCADFYDGVAHTHAAPTMGTGNVADDDQESLVFADEGEYADDQSADDEVAVGPISRYLDGRTQAAINGES